MEQALTGPEQEGREAAALGLLQTLDAITRSLTPSARVERTLRERAATYAATLMQRLRRRRTRPEVFGLGEAAHQADLALAAAAVSGDARAVDAVRQRVQSIVLSRIYAMGLGWNEDELLPSIMDRIWDKLPLYRGQASLPTWAWAVACNYLRNWQRDVGSREARSVTLDGDGAAAKAVVAPPEDAPSYPVEEMEREVRGRRLFERVAEVARQELRPDEWELIQRVIVRGEEYAAIAGEQRERPGTLRVRVFRALNRLREPLQKELGRDAREYLRE